MLTIVTNKTLPCTNCGKRRKIDKTAQTDKDGNRRHLFTCRKCGSLCEYNAKFVDDIIGSKTTI